MLNIVKEFEAAIKYKKYGWMIVSEKQQTQAQAFRKQKYADDLNKVLNLLEDWTNHELISKNMGVHESTAKKYLYELFKQNLVERKKIMGENKKWIYVYRKLFSAN